MNLGKYYSAEYLMRLETTAKYPNRKEGYADYLPGKYYVSPYEMKVNS